MLPNAQMVQRSEVDHLQAEVEWLQDLVRFMDHDHRRLGGKWHLPDLYASLLESIACKGANRDGD